MEIAQQLHFWLGKILWSIVAPSHFLLLMLVVGVILLWLKRKAGKVIIYLVIALLAIIAITPIEYFILAPLEQRIPSSTNFKGVDSIVVLGGGQHKKLLYQRPYSGFGQHNGRIIAAIDFAQKLNVPIIFVGAGHTVNQQSYLESTSLKIQARLAQLPLSQLIINNQSHDTFDNAKIAQELLDKNNFKHSLLITSAAHMPRAVGVFSTQGINFVPFNVEYRLTDDFDFIGQNSLVKKLYLIEYATHEWLGFLKYYSLGMSNTFFPLLSANKKSN